jgi:voltage-gated potassium channel Kch
MSPGSPKSSQVQFGSDSRQCTTLGEALKVAADLLPHEVALCGSLLESLCRSESLAGLPLGADAVEVSRIISSFRSTALDGIQSLSSVADSPQLNQKVSFEPALQDSHESGVLSLGLTDGNIVKPQMPGGSSSDPRVPFVDEEERRWWQAPFLPAACHGGLRRRLFILFEVAELSLLGRFIDVVLVVAIAVSTVSFVMESMPQFRYRPAECKVHRNVENCEPRPDPAFSSIEAVCIIIFTIDYICRITTIHSVPSAVESRLLRTLLYAKQTLNVIDLIAILPFYINLCLGGSAGPIRVLRLARILRLFKTAKHHSGMLILAEVMLMSGQPLLILMFFNGIITVMFAALMYFAEGLSYSVADQFTSSVDDPYQTGVYIRPDAMGESNEVSPFRSIPYAVWWVAVTMTTVGYGDLAPTSLVGRIIGVCCFYVGIIFLALPISVIGTNFELVYDRETAKKLKKKAEKLALRGEKDPTDQKAKVNRQTVIPKEGMPWIPKTKGFRQKLFMILEDPSASRLGKWMSLFVIAVILVSTTSFILESMPEFRYTADTCVLSKLTVDDCEPRPHPFFHTLEVICIVIFTVDYVCRIATVHSVTPEECGLRMRDDEEESEDGDSPRRELSPGKGGLPTPVPITPLRLTCMYACGCLNAVDFFAIVPFYVQLAGGGGSGASVLRVLRLVRIFRVLRMPKMRACADMFTLVVYDSLPALMLLIFVMILMCVLLSSLVVFCEGTHYSVDHFVDLYPDGVYIRPTINGYDFEPSPFQSIFFAFWWFFTTATTVGYGDVVPTTTAGRLVGICTFYTGIVLIALPITVISGAFNKYYPDWVKEFGHEQESDSPTPSPPGTPSHPPIGLRPPLANCSRDQVVPFDEQDSSERNITPASAERLAEQQREQCSEPLREVAYCQVYLAKAALQKSGESRPHDEKDLSDSDLQISDPI